MGKRDWQKNTEKALKSRTATIILLLIPIFLAFFFRAYPLDLPATDNWAEQTLQNNYVSQVENQLRQEFPRLPAAQLRARAVELYEEQASQNPEQVAAQTAQLSQQFKDQLTIELERPRGGTYEQTYFLAIDPYYYLRRAENIRDHGNVCDAVVDGDCIDTRMLAPQNVTTQPDWHSYAEAGFMGAATILNYPPMTGAFLLPAIIAMLAVIPAFFIIKRRWGSFAGMIGATVVAVHTAFLGRTPAGFVDTDVWNVFFPLYIAWLFLIGMDRRDNIGYAYMAGAGLLTAIYSQFWAGWYFTFVVLLLVAIGAAVYALIRAVLAKRTKVHHTKEAEHLLGYAKQAGILLGIFFVVASVFVSLFGGLGLLKSGLLAPVSISVGIQDPVSASLWPNVLTTVAELNTVSIANIVGQIGGRLMFILGALGVFTFALRLKTLRWWRWVAALGVALYYLVLTTPTALAMNTFAWLGLFALPLIATLIASLFLKEEVTIHYGLFLVGWFVASIFATTQGARFLLLLVPIFGLAIGFAAGWLLRYLPALSEEHIEIPAFYGKVAVIIIVLALLFTPVSANLIGRAHATAMNEIPSMNDGWWNALKAIEADSTEDAIITSWWDFGHWFKYISGRRVTFDGASQVGERAHLVGKLLSTEDTESLAILRMLNCGGDRAIRLIEERQPDTLATYGVMQRVIQGNTEEARAVLEEEGYTDSETDAVIQSTHCAPPESYIIASDDMVGKAGVWGHFGAWDFERAYIADAVTSNPRARAISLIQERLNVSETRAAQLYSEVNSLGSRAAVNAWISPWPPLVGVRSCQETNATITCALGVGVGQQQGVTITADTLRINKSAPENAIITLTAQGQEVGTMQPGTLILDGERYAVGGQFVAISVRDGRAVIGDELLVDGLFTNLFYRSEGGEYLDELITTGTFTGGTVKVYKVDWEAYIADAEA